MKKIRMTGVSAISIWIILLVLYLMSGQLGGFTNYLQISIVLVFSIWGFGSSWGLYKFKKWGLISSIIFLLLIAIVNVNLLLLSSLEILGLAIESLLIMVSVISIIFLLKQRKLFHK
jgi:hypothetical protein